MIKQLLIIICLLFFSACALKQLESLGEDSIKRGQWDKAVEYYIKALQYDPENAEYRLNLSKALLSASQTHYQKGLEWQERGELKVALIEFNKATEFNPENGLARRKKLEVMKELAKLDQEYAANTDLALLKEKNRKIEIPVKRLQFKQDQLLQLKVANLDLKKAFSILSTESGIDFLFDEGFKTVKVSLEFKDVNFLQALDKIMIQNKLFYKVIDERTVLIIPDTPVKRKQYEDLIMRTFFLANADAEDMAKIVKDLTKVKFVTTNKKLNTITVFGIPDLVRLTERVVDINDKSVGEVLIEIEIIEVNKKRVSEYGIKLSEYSLTQTYSPVVGSTSSSSSDGAAATVVTPSKDMRMNMLTNTDLSDYVLSLPSVTYKLMRSDTHSRIKARPQIRALDQAKVKISLGDKVPIPMTTFVSYSGNTSPLNDRPITSYTQQDVGINIDLTPSIYLNGYVSLEMKFELTFITNPGTATLPPTIGNRSVNTVIKLRDNETTILAGLLRDTERKSMSSLPFLANVPILKEIFGSNENTIEQTDIILTITPRIVRLPMISESDLEYLPVGTEENLGLAEKPKPVVKEEKNKEKKPETKPAPKDKPATETIPPQVGEKKESEKTADSVKPPDGGKPLAESPSAEAFFKYTGPDIKEGESCTLALVLTQPGRVKAVNLEFDYNPELLQAERVDRGAFFTQYDIQGQLLHQIDPQNKGKVRLRISVDKDLIEGEAELALIRFKALKAGKAEMKPVSLTVVDEAMATLQARFSPFAFDIKAK